jgi:multicomponent Na+:H+ antiporter subunit D
MVLQEVSIWLTFLTGSETNQQGTGKCNRVALLCWVWNKSCSISFVLLAAIFLPYTTFCNCCYFWRPSYKVGVYALLRTFTLIFVPDEFIKATLLSVATATLLTGAFGAISNINIRKIFSYLIVCHIGYMIAGLGLFTQVALSGAIFYLVHDIIIKTNLFLVSGIIYKIKGTVNLKELGGLYEQYPKISLMIAVVLFSLAGIPPLSGFWPKINLFKAALTTNSYIVLAAIIVASFITLYIIAKYGRDLLEKHTTRAGGADRLFRTMKKFHKSLLVAPVLLLVVVALYIGFAADNIFRISNHIATELLDPSPYIKAVLGEERTTIK